MVVYKLNPLADPRWTDFIERHPKASIFHTPGWLEALRRTYGYEPIVLTTAAAGQPLENGLVFCRIESWLTGCRMVSVPFADHCEPLVDTQDNLVLLAESLKADLQRENWKYVEFRPRDGARLEADTKFLRSQSFYFHTLDLRPDLQELFHRFHRSCIQRKIRRAQREGLTYEEGRDETLLQKFYYLLALTRRRHGLPPQPLAWFRNLVDCLGNKVTVRVVSKEVQPIAGILTLRHRDTIVYKYGCSDAKRHNLGGTSLLFWHTIKDGKATAAEILDLGRSEVSQHGLVAYKNHLGASSHMMSYYRYPQRSASSWTMRLVQHTCARLPNAVLIAAGKWLYRHIG